MQAHLQLIRHADQAAYLEINNAAIAISGRVLPAIMKPQAQVHAAAQAACVGKTQLHQVVATVTKATGTDPKAARTRRNNGSQPAEPELCKKKSLFGVHGSRDPFRNGQPGRIDKKIAAGTAAVVSTQARKQCWFHNGLREAMLLDRHK